MDPKEAKQILAPQAAPEPDAATLAREDALWDAVAGNMESEELHRQYVGFILKNNLLKQASRRYGTIIDDADEFSIPERRIARRYQQEIVRILFFQPKAATEASRLSRLDLFVLFIATLLMIAGLGTMMSDTGEMPAVAVLLLKLMFPLGLAFVVAFIWRRIKKTMDQIDSRKV
jgi:RNAse (barnase) inhibitor barstar